MQWGERLIAHYEHNRVDPRTKTLVFSDALTFPKVIDLYRRFSGRARLAFGVGTNLTNDLGYQPLQIVIKMVRCNGQPVAKLSDSPEKNMCDDAAYLAYLRQVESVRANLNRYISTRTQRVVEEHATTGRLLEPEERTVAVLFSDVRGFYSKSCIDLFFEDL